MHLGKTDTVKCNDSVKQARVLTDYLQNLYEKFVSEHPEFEVSFSTFCRIRPKHIQLSAFISRNSCLCTMHQTMTLTAKTLRRDVQISKNPEMIAKCEFNRQVIIDTVAESKLKTGSRKSR